MRFHAGQLTLQAPNRRRRLLAWVGGIVAVACLAGLFIPAWPSLFPGRSGKSPDDAQSQTTRSGMQAPEPPMPQVLTIENGLTVAKDGTGQYTTIGEALDHVKPRQTIRVLDKAVYPEAIKIANPARMEGLTLEAPNGATIQLPSAAQIGLLVLNVPRVTVRGFRLRTDATRLFLCTVGGHSPGVTLETLDVRLDGSACVGVSVEQLSLTEEDTPLVARNCRFAGLYCGMRVSGEAAPSRRVVFRGNDISECTVGIWMGGSVSDLHIVGNRIWNCTGAALQIDGLLERSSGVLIANNSVASRRSCIQILNITQAVQPVTIRNNLLIAEAGIDVELLGKGRAVIAAWQLDHNWRQVRPPTAGTSQATSWIPPGERDTRHDHIADIPRDPGQADFLRPAKDSPLTKGGAGGDLPSYVGAVPPEGAEPWDWDKTWSAHMRKPEKPGGKSGEAAANPPGKQGNLGK
jgi:hypothetical protein